MLTTKPKGIHLLKPVVATQALFAVALSALLQAPPVVAKGELHNLSAPSEIIETKIENKIFQTSKILIKTRPEVVWKILTDYNNADAIFNNLKDCGLVEDKGHKKVVRHEVQPTGLPGRFKYTLEITETPNHMLEWHRVRGDFREVDGYWKLEPADGGKHTLATYSAYINGGLFLPPPLVKRQIRVDMPIVLATLKKEAENRVQTQIAGRPDKHTND